MKWLALFALLPSTASAHPMDTVKGQIRMSDESRVEILLNLDPIAALAGKPASELTDVDSSAFAEKIKKNPSETLERIKKEFAAPLELRDSTNALISYRVEFLMGDQPVTSGNLSSKFVTRIAFNLSEGAFTIKGSENSGLLILVSPNGNSFVIPSAKGVEISASDLNQSGSYAQVIRAYVILGFEHILPKGLDHILFVLGLFLFSTQLAPLFWQVTTFTVAHTLTLGISTLGIVQLSPSVVEPLIALSIVYIAVENILIKQFSPRRVAVVFIFGLLHGLGFAGVLGDLGLPQGYFLSSLLSFNVGVELGQISVLLIAFAVTYAFRNSVRYRSWIVVPASVFIGAVGLYWSIERIFAG